MIPPSPDCVLHLELDEEFTYSFDVDSFRAEGELIPTSFNGVPFGGTYSITVPFLDLLSYIDGNGFPHSLYIYGSGELSIEAQFNNGVSGGFNATWQSLTVDVCEVCLEDFPPGLTGEVNGELGAGLFDPTFANQLGLIRSTFGGNLFVPADGISPLPADPRSGGSANGFADLNVFVAPVPEPGVMALLLVSGSALLARRRRQYRTSADR